MKPTEIVAKLLANATDINVCNELVAENATYVSLNYNNSDLTAIEPWCGTHLQAGPTAVNKTFVDVSRFWEVLNFEIYAIFSGSAEEGTSISTGVHGPEGEAGSNVAVFGRFKYRSRTIGRITDSPFCVWAKVDETTGKITYMQFMEDTLDTAKSFRKNGKMVYASDPDGGEVIIGDDDL